MKIENETKLDYSDVLIRPKRSELVSRKDVSLEREFKFKNGVLEFNAFFSNISHFRTTSESKIDNEKVYITKWYRNTDTDSSPAEYEVYHKEITY